MILRILSWALKPHLWAPWFWLVLFLVFIFSSLPNACECLRYRSHPFTALLSGGLYWREFFSAPFSLLSTNVTCDLFDLSLFLLLIFPCGFFSWTFGRGPVSSPFLTCWLGSRAPSPWCVYELQGNMVSGSSLLTGVHAQCSAPPGSPLRLLCS